MGGLKINKPIAILFIPLILYLAYGYYNKTKLMAETETVCCEVYKVWLNVKKGVTTRRNVARYKYSFNGKNYDQSAEIYTFDVKVGDFFKIKVSKKDTKTHEVIWNKKYSSCEEITE